MSRLFISAAHKSSGKTTVSIGLTAAFCSMGKIVQTYKKGPDYIDPQWLGRASGRDCFNLDFYTMSRDEITGYLAEHSSTADISLIEGNKGLYDGLDIDGSNSNAALAKLTSTPVVLVLDARGMTRGIAPLILGYQAFDKDIQIKGVILNQLGGSRHESKLRKVIEHYTDVNVVGAIHKDDRFNIDERHLGLVPSHEDPYANKKIQQLCRAIKEQVDLETLIQLASTAPAIKFNETQPPNDKSPNNSLNIGIIRNSAFGFYYPDDIKHLESSGATVIYIDNINDKQLPKLDGLFIGGGFPETHLDKLSSNISMKKSIHAAIENGLPVYAECGGLMYLAKTIEWQGKTLEMVGSIDGDITVEKTPQGRGYVQLQATKHHPWVTDTENTICAHEFHYSRFKNMAKNATFAYKVKRGMGINGSNDGYLYKNLLACYTHQRNTQSNPWIKHFTHFINQHKSIQHQTL